LIHTEGLTRRFHDLVAVDAIDLHVEPGEVFGFLGPNGAGKSTTIRILTGFLPATSGRALVAGHDVARESLAVRRRIGYLPESVALPIDARVEEYLDYRARLKAVPARDRARLMQHALEVCGLVPMRRRILSQLSRGYRQRVGLADALLADPPLLILDEPTGGLDPAQRQEVLDLIAALKGKRTVLFSSHVLTEVEHVCSRVAIIQRGRIVASGTRDELERSAGHPGEVAIEAAGAGERLAQSLSRRGIAHDRLPPDGCVAHLGAQGDPVGLLAALVGEGLPIGRFEPRTRSLQQIFLELTRT